MMGYDIRMYVETKTDNAWWRSQLPRLECATGELDIKRNYNLFAILANIRNGYGTAGVERSEGFRPISGPRGLPDDLSDEVRQIENRLLLDKFSHSWLLLSELFAYDWHGQKTKQYAVLTPAEYQAFARDGYPSAGGRRGVLGKNVKMVSERDMIKLVEGEVSEEPGIDYFAQVGWEEKYSVAAGQSWFRIMDELKQLGDPKSTRLVFWFTS